MSESDGNVYDETPHNRVLRPNEQTSEDLSQIPLPARQQLGIMHPRVDVDARSGNGLRDALPTEDTGRGYRMPVDGEPGNLVMPVTYHLRGGNGNYTGRRRNDEQNETGTVVAKHDTGGGVIQREEPGRNEREANLAGLDPEKSSAVAGSDAAAKTLELGTDNVQTSADSSPASEDAGANHSDSVPDGSTADVLKWVGDDSVRARQALEAEQSKSTPRKGLVSALEDKI